LGVDFSRSPNGFLDKDNNEDILGTMNERGRNGACHRGFTISDIKWHFVTPRRRETNLAGVAMKKMTLVAPLSLTNTLTVCVTKGRA